MVDPVVAYLVKNAVHWIIDSIGDAACPEWRSTGIEGKNVRVGVKKEGKHWYIGFHKGAGAGRYRCDGWTVTKLVKELRENIADGIDDEVQEIAEAIWSVASDIFV